MPSKYTLTFLPPRKSKARGLALSLLLLGPFLVGCLALFLGQDANWDLRNYHWYNAYAFLTGRLTQDLLPSQTPSFYNPFIDVPFYLLATHASAKVTAFVLGTVQGINFILIFMLAHATLILNNPRQKVLACAGLAALGMLGGGGIAMIGTTFYDNVTSLGLFASAMMVIRFYPRLLADRATRAMGIAFLCGIPAGLMMGLKLPFVTFCVGLCGALFLATGPWLRRFVLAFGFGLGILLGLAVTMGPWAAFLQEQYQSPLFPYFNNIFASPLAPVASGRDVQFIPTHWDDILLYPFVFSFNPMRVGEIPWQDFRILILFVLFPVAVLARLAFGRNKHAVDRLAASHAVRYLFWLATISYVVWLFLFSIYRYLVPLEMLAPLLIVLAVGMLPFRPQARGLISVFLLVFIALTVQAGDWGRKSPWLDHAIEAKAPAIAYPDKLMILMAGFEPYSHVLTAFPPHITFIRIQSNFASPDEKKGINDLIRQRVMEHQGPKKLLIPEYDYWRAKEALGFFHLAFDEKTCLDVEDHLFKTKLKLCDLQPVSVKP